MSTAVVFPKSRELTLHSLLERRWFRASLLGTVIVALELLMFRGYFSGSTIPPWDFLGGYTTDAYQWWSEGSFFAPIEWIPNVWGGYPASLNVQNSSWYLPVGIASIFGPFTLHSSAIVAALHVAFGFVGVYLLCRSLKVAFPVALVIAVAGFFSVGYFSNAQHIDISRSYALLPWVLLVLSPSWPWKRWWGTALAVLLLWQSVTGMYPGIIVATVYVGVVWIAVHQWRERPAFREYLLPAALSFLAAILLCLPRLLPYFLTRESDGGVVADGSIFSPAMIGTLQFGYSSGALANDISMRSFFVPATVLLLSLFARLRHPATAQALALGLPAFLLGMPMFPWFEAIQSFPGLSLSRFTMSDFKVFMILAALLLGAAGLSALISISNTGALDSRTRLGLVFGAILTAAFVGIGVLGPYSYQDWIPGTVTLGIVYVVLLGFVVFRDRRFFGPHWLAILLSVLTVLSGFVWAYGTPVTWRTARVSAETNTYGAPISELIESRSQGGMLDQRPERLAPPSGYDLAELRDTSWNVVFFTGEAAIGGYANLKGSHTIAELEKALLDPVTGEDFAGFLASSGRAVTSTTDSDLSRAEMVDCGIRGACGAINLVPSGYSPGALDYRVTAQQPTEAIFNEAYYKGWSIQACSEKGACTELDVKRDETGLIQASLPSGDYMLELRYQSPGRVAGWISFGMGIAIVFAMTFVLSRSQLRKKVVKL